jgi:hypothetical protein
MDDELRRRARRAREAVERDVDTDAALDRFSTAGDTTVVHVEGRRRTPRWVLPAIAAATALVIAGGLVVLRGDTDDELTMATAPSTVPVTLTTGATTPGTAPSTVPTATTEPDTTSTLAPGPTTTTTPETTTTLLLNPSSIGDFPTERSRITRQCADGTFVGCTQLALAPDGTTVSFDPRSGTLTMHAVPPVSTVLSADLGDPAIVAVGPDDVVYLSVQAPGIDDPVGDLVAVSLAAGDGGAEIRRWPSTLDRSGDTELVATPAGMAEVGCCDAAPVRPAPDVEARFPWVRRDGTVTEAAIPYLQVRYDTMQVQRDGTAWPLRLDADEHLLRGMPAMVATFDGGVIATFVRLDGSATIVRAWPDGTTDELVLDRPPALVEPTGTVVGVVDDGDDRFVRADPWLDRRIDWEGSLELDTDDWSLTAPGLDAFLSAADPSWERDPVAFADAVVGPAALNEVRSIRVVADDPTGVSVEVVTSNFFDDSVFASRQQLELTRLGGDLRLTAGTASQVCQPDRGQQTFEAELCV